VPDRSIRLTMVLTLDATDDRSIRAVAEEDFGVEAAADMTIADVIAAVVRNTLDAQFHGFGVPVDIAEVTAVELRSEGREE